MRWVSPLWLLLLVLACAREPTVPVAPRALPARLEWDAVPGATRYTVRGWSGSRLIFEEQTQEAWLELDAATQRACAQFESLEVHIRAQELPGDRIVLRLRP